MMFRKSLPLLLGLLLVPYLPARAQLIHDLVEQAVSLSEPRSEAVGKRAQYTYTSLHSPTAYTGVALQGYTESRDVAAWIRFSEAPGAWSDWSALLLVRSATDGTFLAAYRGTAVRANQPFELRLSVGAEDAVHLVEIGVFDNRLDDDRAAFELTTTPAPKADLKVTPPILVTRGTWGASPFRGTPVSLARPDYRRMTFHHAAGFTATTMEEGIAQVKAIQTFHQDGRGWSDIGYQFVVDRGGHVFQGRPFMDAATTLDAVPTLAQGAHVGGANTGNIGVCILGCYHPPEAGYPCTDVITPVALDTMVTLFAFLSEAYGVDPDDLLGHRDQGNTSCPGDNNYVLLPQIREDIVRLKITGNAPLGSAALTAEVGDGGVVRLGWTFLSDFGITGYRIQRTIGGETVVLFEGSGALPDEVADATLTQTGTARYELFAYNSDGREQRLAATEVAVQPPSDYVLASGFPNPFTNRATIRYYLPRDGLVTLRVFDGAGREVQTLVQSFQEGERWYVRTLDAAGLASGLYLYRLEVEGFSGVAFSETQTMVLLR